MLDELLLVALMVASMPRDGSYLHSVIFRSRLAALLPPPLMPETEPPELLELEELVLSEPPVVEELKPPLEELELLLES
ncbi:hypothetical protein GCM10010329_49090 [Streptomyces spiroverticillatus]|uniref:Uncharacterized protein n=1 Tax=Streptomyces finlayi TaxID=67296 RepID=A0A918X1G3_9ACTN|nr:hypothetical protein GCM10010329_49090 [Streptomyces spiroverticillatus]GHD02910.1 hypothetical protein GCM10010334_50040 [Streptomyces finlayi]